MRIREVKCHVASLANSWLTDSVIANPMSIYPEYWERRSSWYGAMTCAVIEVVLENGESGFGFIGGAKGGAVPAILEEQLRRLVVDRSVFETELVSEQLYRASVFYGRGGLAMSVISGIDIAMWDAKGKLLGQPVYNLLGGKTMPRMKAYYTGNDPDALAEFGIGDMKIAMPFGPAHGEQGMQENERVVARARETIGDQGFIALDIYMAWTVDYTVRMYERLAKYRIAWIEEPVMPDNYKGYREIRRSVNTKVSGGEHEYTLEGFRRLIGEDCVDLVQPDIYRAGGPTALKKIAALAKAHNIELICHGVGSPTYHFLISNGPDVTPRCEYLDIYRGSESIWVLSDDPRPKDGYVELSETPGFGYSLNAAAFGPNAKPVAPIW